MAYLMRSGRSSLVQILDWIFLPYRGLFVGSRRQLGLSSIREQRMRKVADECRGTVLDIGCGPGNLFIGEFIGREHGLGIDVYAYEGVDTIVQDMEQLPFDDCSWDSVTLIAVGGHIPKHKRKAEFAEFARVLKTGGRLIMTEGELVSQTLRHKWTGWLSGGQDMDSVRGMDADEEYAMPRHEILTYLNSPPLALVKHERFMWRLNNVYVAEKRVSAATSLV